MITIEPSQSFGSSTATPEGATQPRLGVIMLNTHFPRLPGDVGNPQTFAFPSQYVRVQTATVDRVISAQGVQPDVAEAILQAAIQLEQQGVELIVTSCGFLGELQGTIESHTHTPLLSSSLMLVPLLRNVFGRQARLGVLTFDSRKLKPLHFNGHHDQWIDIEGIEGGQELHRVISQDLPALDPQRAEADVLAAVDRLLHHKPAALLLECTNLSPYIEAIRQHSGLPVFDLIQAIHWLLAAKG
ncbi:hypothetical protein QCD60_04970 [Pokkaliibacter sp. MBI-7]|uniref:aspartate/glutamate racemase family protein n=1 Tax=Pokkaliibacter sp. MBI-7 TaxID=3040600 RepID=UPI00244B8934|nr:aspartate/glutamate racemase family protein [Pokkaliibacter sp. MBI-7]MDH2431905.1 hypothetical protein [Pokkaliibacter sp. MBI-7]